MVSKMMSRDGRTIRVGLIGYGFAGRVFHAPLIRSVPGLALAVVGSSRREAVQADIPDAIICNPDEVATHPDVDLVVIATPNESHFPLAAAALRTMMTSPAIALTHTDTSMEPLLCVPASRTPK